MDRETVLKYTKRLPFTPFALHLSDGQVLHVQQPELLAFGDGVLGLKSESATAHVVDLDQIVSLQYAFPGRQR